MNYPIQADELTIDMLRGVYQFSDERLYQGFINELYNEDVYDSMDDLIDEMSSFEIDMQVYESLENDFEDYYNAFEDNTHPLIDDITNQAMMFKQRRFFKEAIHKDLITAAMHLNRIQKQIDQFDDIEDFFKAIGC
jgi:hypothetical protein